MHRTDTTNFISFELSSLGVATFIFPSSSAECSSASQIRIVIPPRSVWRMPPHWHPSESRTAASQPRATLGCERITCVSGRLRVYVAQGLRGSYDKVGSEGMSVKFAPGQRVAWNRASNDDKTALEVDLVADPMLWRNYCSAVLDRDIFPRLSSTPWWVKALFAILTPVPRWREGLLSVMLWIQLQTIYTAHDFHVPYGYVPVTWPWIYQPFGGRAPGWARRLELRSLYLIAWVVMRTAYLIGTLLLGMKGEYSEYTPSEIPGDEKKTLTAPA